MDICIMYAVKSIVHVLQDCAIVKAHLENTGQSFEHSNLPNLVALYFNVEHGSSTDIIKGIIISPQNGLHHIDVVVSSSDKQSFGNVYPIFSTSVNPLCVPAHMVDNNLTSIGPLLMESKRRREYRSIWLAIQFCIIISPTEL